jgi:23S rRNA U2552 (ribose-2'-O)-methylase RlmE/FtsJ
MEDKMRWEVRRFAEGMGVLYSNLENGKCKSLTHLNFLQYRITAERTLQKIRREDKKKRS